MTSGTKVIAYLRVSTDEQADSGAGLAAQRDAIEREAAHRGWELVRVIEDAGYSGKDMKRPGIAEAIRAVEAGEASAIVTSKLDRLSRSLLDFAGLMERARRRGWAVVALDLGVDTTTPDGEMMSNVLATFAQFERRLIGARTKEGLAAKRRRTETVGYDPERGGLKAPIGRKPAVSDETRDWI